MSTEESNNNTNTNIIEPVNKYKPPCRTTKETDDIEDIVIGGIARPRPDVVKYLCPFRRRLIPGETYYYCQCGKSEDIFCDGTCKEEPTLRGPYEFTVDADVRNHAMCGCRYTSNPPFCDGNHTTVKDGLDEWLAEHPEDKEKVPWHPCAKKE